MPLAWGQNKSGCFTTTQNLSLKPTSENLQRTLELLLLGKNKPTPKLPLQTSS